MEDSNLEKGVGKQASDDKWTTSCYYTVQVLCMHGVGTQIKKKALVVWGYEINWQ